MNHDLVFILTHVSSLYKYKIKEDDSIMEPLEEILKSLSPPSSILKSLSPPSSNELTTDNIDSKVISIILLNQYNCSYYVLDRNSKRNNYL